MRIKREKYLKMLQIRQHNGFVKVITGIRRCGKSYLLKEIFYEQLKSEGVNEDHIIKFAFDSADDLLMINEDLQELYAKKKKVDPKKFMAFVSQKMKDDNMYYLLLDEVQNLDNFYFNRGLTDMYEKSFIKAKTHLAIGLYSKILKD